MSSFITHIYSIQKHPIKKLEENKRILYLSGLGAFLCTMTKEEEVRFLFNAWCYSILAHYQEEYDFFKTNKKENIKKAIFMENPWWQFYTLKDTFFFDCFYLLCFRNYVSPESVYDALKGYCCYNPFYQKALKAFYCKYISQELDSANRLDASLVSQYKLAQEALLNKPYKVLVVANVSAGKSMLINAITGHRICKSANMACTDSLHYIYNKRVKDIAVCESNEKYKMLEQANEAISIPYRSMSLNFNSLLSDSNICFIDTPGINNSIDEKHRQITQKAISANQYDALIYVANCQYFGTNDERNLLESVIKHCKKPIIYVLNQLDKFDEENDSISEIMDDFKKDLIKLGEKNPTLIPFSAYAAFLMKQDGKSMNKHEKSQFVFFQETFSIPYYNLPQYIGKTSDKSLLEKTGITLLEKTILKNIAL